MFRSDDTDVLIEMIERSLTGKGTTSLNYSNSERNHFNKV